MVKFTQKAQMKGTVENKEGEIAWELSDKETLMMMSSACLMNEPKFYGEKGEAEIKIRNLAEKIARDDPCFIMQLALFLRHEYYLRSMPMYLTAIAAHEIPRQEKTWEEQRGIPKCYGNFLGAHPRHIVRMGIPMVISRADELNELLAAYMNTYGKPIPNALKKGIAESFGKFDEYQMGKYFREKNHPNFVDTMRLVHPKKPQALLKKIINGELETPYTWETELSKKDERTKEEKWKELIMSGKVGYMALIRNLRNILDNIIDVSLLKIVSERISAPAEVRRSKQFPFRFWSAYNELDGHSNPYARNMRTAIGKALEISFENIPHMDGTTAIFCDVSGSMESPVSQKSSIKMYDIGILLGLGAAKFTDGIVFGVFGERFATITPEGSTVLGNMKDCRSLGNHVGHSTNGYLAIDYLTEHNIPVDRVLVFTDMQMWDSQSMSMWGRRIGGGDRTFNQAWQGYKQKVNPDAKVYLFNLAGYSEIPLPGKDPSARFVGGWSEKIFRYIEATEKGATAQVEEIYNYFLPDRTNKSQKGKNKGHDYSGKNIKVNWNK